MTDLDDAVVDVTTRAEQLETDQDLLIPKARTALTRYGHQAVIGNELHKRKYEVVLVENDDDDDAAANEQGEGEEAGGRFRETWLRLSDLGNAKRALGKGEDELVGLEIEELLVEELVKRHERWIAAGAGA